MTKTLIVNTKLKELSANLKSIVPNNIIFEIFSETFVRDWIIEANQNQLAEKGEASDGRKLRTYFARQRSVYSKNTMEIKQNEKSGLAAEIGHVTLYDTGDFYKSFKSIVNKTFARLNANFKDIAENLDITGIMGLNRENINLLLHFIIYPRFLHRMKVILNVR